MAATTTVAEPWVGAQQGEAPALRDALRWGVAAWVLLRVLASVGAWISLSHLHQDPVVAVPGYTAPVLHGAARVFAGAWLRSDALWYLRIAKVGYAGNGGTFAFLPVFPLLVRWLAPALGGRELYAALLVSNVACAVGFVFLFAFLESLAGGTVARVGVVALALFPTAFFLVAPYGEPLLLASGAICLWAAQRDRPEVAGLAGAVAALTRPFGILLVIPLAGYAVMKGHVRNPRWLLAPAGPVAGLTIWVLWVGSQLHDRLGAFKVQAVWQRTLTAPWVTTVDAFKAWHTWRATLYGPYFAFDILATAFGLALVVVAATLLWRRGAARWVVAGLALYGLATIVVPMTTPYLPRPMMSNPRFMLALFPLFGAAVVAPRWLRIPLGVLSAGGLVLGTAVFVASRPLF